MLGESCFYVQDLKSTYFMGMAEEWRKNSKKFPDKLWYLVNNPKEDCCFWSDDGKSVIIDKSRFSVRHLSKANGMFKTDNFASFVRQLNLYGFRKEHRLKAQYPPSYCIYRHENFKRGAEELLKMVTRKGAKFQKINLSQSEVVDDLASERLNPSIDGDQSDKANENGGNCSFDEESKKSLSLSLKFPDYQKVNDPVLTTVNAIFDENDDDVRVVIQDPKYEANFSEENALFLWVDFEYQNDANQLINI